MAFTSSTVRKQAELPAGSCSLPRDEALPGTAAQVTTWVLVEHPGGWGRDILDGSAFGQPLSTELSARMEQLGARLLLVRKPGREGQVLMASGESRRAYLARVGGRGFEPAVLYTFEVSDVADLLTLPLEKPETIPGLVVSRETLVLICTHSKRDRCCALLGRPLAAFLQEQSTGVQVWECSHTGGHRFGPVALTLPSGYTYGRLTFEQALTLASGIRSEQLALAGLRGRSAHTPIEQVAEVAVRSYLAQEGEKPRINDLSPERVSTPAEGIVQSARVTHRDGRAWLVTAHEVELPARPASCGKDPSPATSWQVESIAPTQPAEG
ncbi:sucrase ferredoxin [Rothia sp. P5764]|uniref:sucrase ferredoxin n=1 Tax=Rothia sp. P5764 TaxID=3402654 RepID=UPI003AD75E79